MEEKKYILKDSVPAEEPDLIKWEKWMETENMAICRTSRGESQIDTIFLGYAYNEDLFFTTTVVGGKYDKYERFYPDIKSAEKGHEEVIALVAFENERKRLSKENLAFRVEDVLDRIEYSIISLTDGFTPSQQVMIIKRLKTRLNTLI